MCGCIMDASARVILCGLAHGWQASDPTSVSGRRRWIRSYSKVTTASRVPSSMRFGRRWPSALYCVHWVDSAYLFRKRKVQNSFALVFSPLRVPCIRMLDILTSRAGLTRSAAPPYHQHHPLRCCFRSGAGSCFPLWWSLILCRSATAGTSWS